MTFLSVSDTCFTVLFNDLILSVYKKYRQASTGRPGRPNKTTGRPGRPGKMDDRHRQAVEVDSLS